MTMRYLVLAMGVALAFSLLHGVRAQAMMISVTTTEDELLTNGRCSLREAIRNANANAVVHPDCETGTDTILVPSGLHRFAIGGMAEDAAATGDLDITRSVTLIGAGAASTTIDANALDRVFEILPGATVSIQSVTIAGGSLGDILAGGGGIKNRGTLTLTGSTIRGNTGSGIENDVVMTVVGSTIASNSAFNSSGGGVRNAGSLTIVDSEIAGNGAVMTRIGFGGSGGGIANNGTLTMTGSTVASNSALSGFGGGIYNDAQGTATLTNVTFSGNQAQFNGGSLYTVGAVTLTNVTVVDGDVTLPPPSGGDNIGLGIGSGTVQARNTIVASNPGILNCSRPLISEGHNLDSDTSCGFTAPGDLSNTSSQLGPLATNSGRTRTRLLLEGSPAIDAGSNTGCPSTDQRGAARPRDGDGNGTFVCDIGAVEAGGIPAPPAVTPTITPTMIATVPPTLCAPRPNIRLEPTHTGPGTLAVVVTLATSIGTPTNVFQRISFDTLTNATVEVPGSPPQLAGFAFTPGAGSQASFVVRRVSAGAFSVRLTIVDACGDWPTFVGGGPNVP